MKSKILFSNFETSEQRIVEKDKHFFSLMQIGNGLNNKIIVNVNIIKTYWLKCKLKVETMRIMKAGDKLSTIFKKQLKIIFPVALMEVLIPCLCTLDGVAYLLINTCGYFSAQVSAVPPIGVTPYL